MKLCSYSQETEAGWHRFNPFVTSDTSPEASSTPTVIGLSQDPMGPAWQEPSGPTTISGLFISGAPGPTAFLGKSYGVTFQNGSMVLRAQHMVEPNITVGFATTGLLVPIFYRGGDWEIVQTPMLASHRAESNIDYLIEYIDALRRGVEDEVVPTDFAYESAKRILRESYSLSERIIPNLRVPQPSITTDDVGGIRVTWRDNDQLLVANFGAQPGLKSYLYRESATEHGSEALKPANLAGRLSWLQTR